jgi:hypothetical protein
LAPSQLNPEPAEARVRTVALHVVTWKISVSHHKPHHFGGLFSFSGSPRELCFNASFRVRGRWCLANKVSERLIGKFCTLLPRSRESRSRAPAKPQRQSRLNFCLEPSLPQDPFPRWRLDGPRPWPRRQKTWRPSAARSEHIRKHIDSHWFPYPDASATPSSARVSNKTYARSLATATEWSKYGALRNREIGEK